MALIDTHVVTDVALAEAAGIGTYNSGSVNVEGFDGVAFVISFGAIVIGSVITVQLQESSDNATWANVGAAISYTASAAQAAGKFIIADLLRPASQYVRAVVTVATANATIQSGTAVQYTGKNNPVSQGNVLASSFQESI